jgi:F-type H+/Na+-transporting ATPase subunit beta
MNDDLLLNVSLLRRRVPNLTSAAKSVGLRPATVSNLCTGKISVGKAEVKTIVALANLANCTIDDLIIQGSGLKMLETGIKVIDLFAPIVKGGVTGFVARAQMGQLVVLSELVHRLKQKQYTTILLTPKDNTDNLDDVDQTVDNSCHTIDDTVASVSLVEDKNNILLAVDRSFVLTGELYQLREKLESEGFPDITTVLFDPTGEVVDEEDSYGLLDTVCYFDMDLIARRIYPAIHPVFSTSVLQEDALLENNHLTIQRKARKLLRRYREVRVLANTIGMENISEADTALYKRGELLEAFCSQPFFVAEPFTKKVGEYVALKDTISGAEKILEGKLDDTDPSELLCKGKIN